MSHRLFAQIAFERALGDAAIRELESAMKTKARFNAMHDLSDPANASLSAELDTIVTDRLGDVLSGTGLKNIEFGDRQYAPEVIALVKETADRLRKPG